MWTLLKNPSQKMPCKETKTTDINSWLLWNSENHRTKFTVV